MKLYRAEFSINIKDTNATKLMLEIHTLKSLNVTYASVIKILEKEKNCVVCILYDSPRLRLLKQKYLHSETPIYEIYHQAPPHLNDSTCPFVVVVSLKLYRIL